MKLLILNFLITENLAYIILNQENAYDWQLYRCLCFNGFLQPEIEEFLELLALCHTVRVDHHEANQTGASALYSHTGMEYEYQSSSPDEKAFVEACRR